MDVSPIPTAKPHLGYAATGDTNTVIVCGGGKVIITAERSVIGDLRFNLLREALENQQSLESLKLIVNA